MTMTHTFDGVSMLASLSPDVLTMIPEWCTTLTKPWQTGSCRPRTAWSVWGGGDGRTAPGDCSVTRKPNIHKMPYANRLIHQWTKAINMRVSNSICVVCIYISICRGVFTAHPFAKVCGYRKFTNTCSIVIYSIVDVSICTVMSLSPVFDPSHCVSVQTCAWGRTSA